MDVEENTTEYENTKCEESDDEEEDVVKEGS